MSRRARTFHSILAIAFAIGLAGCGSNDNGSRFEDCGNGVVDKGEQCDDGNLVDEDSCTSTCELNVCGDGFLDPGVEECDLVVKGKSCADFGFAGGTLDCSTSCKIDTSGCNGVAGPTPTPGPTPTGETGTPTPTAAGLPGTPSPTPTPGAGATCEDGQTVVVIASLDQPYAAFSVNLSYPTSVNLPGSGTSVGDRVTFAVSGLTSVDDQDRIGDDGVDDTLVATFASGDSHDAGPVFTVTFACVADSQRPSAADFTCAASASTSTGDDIPGIGCTLDVH